MTKSIFYGAGYMFCDDTASGGKRVEQDMLGCNHCQALIAKGDWKAGKTGGYCPACDGPMCDHCIPIMRQRGCETFVKKFTHQVNQAYLREQNYRILGI